MEITRRRSNEPEDILDRIEAERAAGAVARPEQKVPDNPMLAAALAYLTEGRCVIPVGKDKKPLIPWDDYKTRRPTENEVRQFWTRWPSASIAMVMGRISGVVAVDLDVKREQHGPENWEKLKADRNIEEPLTRTHRTGSGGTHRIYLTDEVLPTLHGTIGGGVDFQAEGSYVLVPPSPGYTVEDDRGPAPLPDSIRKLVLTASVNKEKKERSARQRAGERIPAGIRNDSLTSHAGLMHHLGLHRDVIRQGLQTMNAQQCDPPLPESDVEQIVESIERYNVDFPLTDLGNTRRLVARHGENLMFVPAWGWLVWDGTRWKKDETGEVYVRAKAVVGTIIAEAAASSDAKVAKEKEKWWKASQSENRIRDMVKLAETEPDIVALPRHFDGDPLLLNVLNGTIDLRTGERREHRREDFITKVAPVNYDPGATAQLWQAFLERVLPDAEVRDFIQRAVGWTLTGDTSEQVLFMLLGTGANGKSTFLETIRALLGDFAGQADFETFVKKRNGGGPREDIARLAGLRLVCSIEVESGRQLAEALLKQITGGDTIAARALYKSTFEYVPQFKLFMAANQKPVVRGTDLAIWRRILLVPFDVTIPESERDKELKGKLRVELPGILNWALAGYGAWKKQGLAVPGGVTQATEDYRDEMDRAASVRYFVDECCTHDRTRITETGVLYVAYLAWCERNQAMSVGDAAAFGKALRALGYRSTRMGKAGRRGWVGIQLSNAQAEADTPVSTKVA